MATYTYNIVIVTALLMLISDGEIQQVAQSLRQEPFFENPQTEGVYWLINNDTTAGVQKINVREELVVPYILAKINYNSTGIPSLGAFDIGDNSLLGARVHLVENEWLITIEKRQDYENPQQRIYFFQIYIKDALQPYPLEQNIFITLENIFDNSPTITYGPSPCKVEELHSNHLTDCTFVVYDPDGMDRNTLRIEVQGDLNENALFAFEEDGEMTTFEKQYKLKILKELHFEEKAIYNLDVKVYDANNNTGNIYAILEVVDLPNRDPIWVRPLTTATFNEKEEQIFTLKAIDGDTGIDKPICYRLEFEENYSHIIDVNSTTGILRVKPIDRDILNQQIFSFYTCAYKCDDPSWFIRNSTILIVQDINDHKPDITMKPDTVQILEGKYLTLPLDMFYVEDMDLGANASYNVYFVNSNESIQYSEAFSMIPNSGYQKTDFSLNVIQADKLDFENDDWKSFELLVSAEELENIEHTSVVSLHIELINWNDEWPLFEYDSYNIELYENVTKDTRLIQIQAIDKDVDDHVVHSIVGNIDGILIDPLSGLITLSDGNIFDYERQNTVMIQIQAKDSLITTYTENLHTSYTQLLIKVLDINDETPELRMPRFVVNITENSTPQASITNRIEARDPDTTANLQFDILWKLSYATKSGQEVDKYNFYECFVIDREVLTNNFVRGHLKINPEFEDHVDYEKYDTIFLTIKVTDDNQETNDDSSTAVLTIRIDDINDNPPQFRMGTLEETRMVNEASDILSSIGTIEAFDIDGSGNNEITFELRRISNSTPQGWISINETTGLLKVAGLIECDVPKIYKLEYEVIISDGMHQTKGNINISIIDINNQAPVIDDFQQQVLIAENSLTGEFVGRIRAHDDDRDSPHNTLEYTINTGFAEIHNLFQINITTGVVTVNLRNGYYLDRDMGVTYHYIPIDIRDNFKLNSIGYGPVNQKSTFVNVTQLDVNDNAPVMPDTKQIKFEFSEADVKNTVAKADFIAEDKDEPNTANSQLSYRILSIEPVLDNNPELPPYDDLFTMNVDNHRVGKLKAQRNLKGFYGLWNLEIEASDHGIPSLKNVSHYEINIKPYNFHIPELRYPEKQKSIRICYSLQEPFRPLYEADCVTRLKAFQVYDPDGGEYGDIHFEISSDVGHDQYFELSKELRNSTNLYVKTILAAGIYNINLRAIDGGGSTSEELRNLKIVFVDMLGNPMFLQPTFQTNFTENEEGLLEQRFIPEAYDPKNEGLDDTDELYKLYYFIDNSTFPEDALRFELDPISRQLKLKSPLDREILDHLIIHIKVSNKEDGLITNPNSVNYTLVVHIQINDVNDNSPTFSQNFYAAGITSKDSLGKVIITLKADDPDLNDQIKFRFVAESYEIHGQHLSSNYSELFLLDPEAGKLTLGAYVLNKMSGYVMFKVEASDLVGHASLASVKIYIVSENNRVRFVFLSDIQSLRRNEQFLREQFQSLYGYDICNIDSIDDMTNALSQKSLRQGNINATTSFITEVKVHFIHNNEAVNAYDIQKRSNDLAFISRLQNTLQLHNLILNDIPHLESIKETPLDENWLLITLVAMNVILGIVLGIISFLYLYKVRTLKKQLKAFEPAEFGSVASNLNRIARPAANIFSVEGSNPVFNRQLNETKKPVGFYDNETSTDSEDDEEDEFDGLHDDPLFEMNNMNILDQKTPADFKHKVLNNEFFTRNEIVKTIADEENKKCY